MTDQFLFVGNFLQAHKSTVGISQKICNWLKEEDQLIVKGVSNRKNQFFRFIDIVRSILTIRPKLIYADTYSDKAFLIAAVAVFCAKLIGSKINLTLRGGKLVEFYHKYPGIIGWVLRKADTLSSPSLFLVEKFGQLGFRVNYFPNPVRLDHFPFDRMNVKPHTLLWVRGFNAIYNPELAVRTLYEIRKKFPDARLTMIGPDGGLLANIKLLINSLNLNEAIDIPGPVPNEELFRYFQTHEVYLNTTSYESFGVAVVEAASCGIPIVSTNVGEIPYIWQHEKNILLVQDFQPESFAKQIDRILVDHELARQLSLSAQQISDSFSWTRLKPEWLKIIHQ
ncbi:MAG: glycosyltransferase family 4 protein [Chitinophagaceae bacterium]|nr:glycosyltransferase family 4 protein [Chitinophagaceae bacterium]